MKMKLKISISQFETIGESPASRMNEMENRISKLDDKVEELDHSGKEYEKKFKHGNGICRTYEME